MSAEQFDAVIVGGGPRGVATVLRTATPSMEDRPAAVSSFRKMPMQPQSDAATIMFR